MCTTSFEIYVSEVIQDKLGIVEIRKADLKDISGLSELREMMQLEEVKPSDDFNSAEFRRAVGEYLRTSLGNGAFFSVVAEESGNLVGCAGVIIYQKLPQIDGSSGKVGYVTNVFVKEEFRHRRLGTQMIESLIQYAGELNIEKLHLGASEISTKMYLNLGFSNSRYSHLEYRPELPIHDVKTKEPQQT